jgi:O-acetyl-ADP-ribose deacetylase
LTHNHPTKDDHREDKPLPAPDDIQALLEFLPIFETPGFEYGKDVGIQKREDGSFSLPYYTTSEDTSRFQSTLYRRGFIRPFDWGSWKHEAERYVDDPAMLEAANLDTLCKLLTLHARKERFCEGHLAGMYECGHLTAVLRRSMALLR